MEVSFSAGMPMPVSDTMKWRCPMFAYAVSDLNSQRHFASIGELDRVPDQVGQDLTQPAGISQHAFPASPERSHTEARVPSRRPGERAVSMSPQCITQVEGRPLPNRLFPASIFEKSRMSLITFSRDSPESFTVSKYSLCSARQIRLQRADRSSR